MEEKKSRNIVQMLIASVCILGFVILTLVVIMVSTRCENKNILDKNEINMLTGRPIESSLGLNTSDPTLLDTKVKFLSRLAWLALPPVEKTPPLKTPVPYVIIWHTATENCSDEASCVFHVRKIQTFHIESRHWWDIAYNFLIGGDGNIYEGRGWKKEGSHTFAYNSKSIGIAFMGTFIQAKPPDWQIHACKILIELGVKKGYIAQDYKLFAATQVSTTQSPGAALYEDIKTWPHWSAKP